MMQERPGLLRQEGSSESQGAGQVRGSAPGSHVELEAGAAAATAWEATTRSPAAAPAAS